jgi:hypothetical protein
MKNFILLLITLTGNYVMAQSVKELEPAIEALKKAQVSLSEKPVSFDVRYIYANEHKPGEVLDSVTGRIEIAGNNYRCVMENTETVRNDRYNIVLFNDDQIIYLSKGVSQGAATDPLLMMQSVLKDAGAKNCQISSKGKYKTIRISFAPDAPCKQIEITLDTVSQRLSDMQYIVKTTQLTEAPGADAATPEGYDEYAVVKASFYNYSTTITDSSRFDERTFFYKEGDVFKAAEAYKNYKIFIGSPNL